MNLTIEKVFSKPREWTGQYGPSCAVKVLFTDESEGEYITKPDKAEGIIQTLQQFVGKPTDFEVEDKPDYQGIKQRKIKSWPGKQQPGQFGGGGGSGRQYVPAWGNTEEGERFIQERMDRRTALMQAVALCSSDQEDWETTAIMHLAGTMYDWLRASASVPAAPQATTPVQTPEKGQNASPVPTDGQNGQGKKPLTPEEAAYRIGARWLRAWMDECHLPSDAKTRNGIATEALACFDTPVEDLKSLTETEWATVKAHCQSMTDEDILAWQAVAKNAVGAK